MKIEGNRLILEGRTLELEHPIEDVLKIADRIVVLFRYDGYSSADENAERNCVGLDAKGSQRWRIQQTPSSRLNPDNSRMWNPYVAIELLDDQQKLVAYDAGGLCWKVDPDTGEVSDPIFTR